MTTDLWKTPDGHAPVYVNGGRWVECALCSKVMMMGPDGYMTVDGKGCPVEQEAEET